MPSDTLRCGRIDYTNDLPVYAAFDAGAVSFPGTLRGGVPTELNRALIESELDCSPVSSFFYAQHAGELVLLPRVCIGSQSEVRSICLISATAPQKLAGRRILVTKESATGRALLETICRLAFGFAPELVEAADSFEAYRTGGACLLIGDRALDAAMTVPRDHVHDVGLLWYEHFRVPMVYAVWAARRDVAERHPEAVTSIALVLEQARDWGAANMEKVVALAQRLRARPSGFYESYYRTLNFDFDAAAQAGLTVFFERAASCGLLGRVPRLEFIGETLVRTT